MRLTYFGHSCCLLEIPDWPGQSKAGLPAEASPAFGHLNEEGAKAGTRLVLDPYFTDNPLAPCRAADIECDYVLCSHGHDDHICDALEISRRNRAPIIANYEISEFFAAQGAETHGLNPGGGFDFPFGRIKLTLAFHSSSQIEKGRIIYLGEPCGLLISAAGKTLYHAGDTALFSDMRLIGRGGLDAALLPIGDNFTMGPADALDALDFLQPRVCVPIHYNTWPIIRQDAEKFAADAAARGHEVRPLKSGESLFI
ncbi:MAG: metal-dependent hydrolase [Opitutaceae bacterium]|jgi:L-ascorbate metabolism protein UlaG (beta-lactamase superfamily)